MVRFYTIGDLTYQSPLVLESVKKLMNISYSTPVSGVHKQLVQPER